MAKAKFHGIATTCLLVAALAQAVLLGIRAIRPSPSHAARDASTPVESGVAPGVLQLTDSVGARILFDLSP